MGSSCGCATPFSALTPRITVPEHNKLSTQRLSKPKFDDINPNDCDYCELSEINLNVFKNQLSNRIKDYEGKNGVISKTMISERQWSVGHQGQNIGISQRQFLKQQIKDQKKSNQIIIELSHSINKENFELVQEQFSSSVIFEKEGTQNASCLLSQVSNILNNSIFTDRINVNNQFYEKHNFLGQTKLLIWSDEQRQSYCISRQQLKQRAKQGQNSKFLVLLKAIMLYNLSQEMNLISYSRQPFGLKLYFNGKKRLFPLVCQDQNKPSLKQISEQVITLIESAQISQFAYYFTGWIPEILYLSDIKDFQGIFQRLSTNLQEGNILTFFSRKNHLNKQQYFALKQINFQAGNIVINTGGSPINLPELLIQKKNANPNELSIKLQDFIQIFDTIYLNWNPTIYDLIIKREGILSSVLKRKIRYKLIIPPSRKDIQIRIFLQRHKCCFINQKKQKMMVQLFQSFDDLDNNSPIRTMDTTSSLCSDVFIFQSCREKTEYILTVQVQDQENLQKDVYFTISMFSFVEMSFEKIEESPLIREISLNTKIDSSYIGFGINSPYFDKNIQFVIETQEDRELVVSVQASLELKYQICLIPDTKSAEIITKIDLQKIINESLISNQKNGNGSYTIKTSQKKYVLLLNTYECKEQNINLKIALFGNSNNTKEHILNIKQISNFNKTIFVQEVKWFPTHSGPRKRLKSNSNDSFQPVQNFSDFFKNPFIDKYLSKGKYQFFIKSQTFKEYFDSVDTYQDKNMCEPPALSLAIFEVQATKKMYRIVMDDVFYVPFGIGFWSAQIQLQDRNYRIVCPKIEKGFAIGTFGIVKCQ